MRTKLFSHSLFMASSLFARGFARTCKPQTVSFSLSSYEITYSTAAESTAVSEPTSETTSLAITLSSDTASTTTTKTSDILTTNSEATSPVNAQTSETSSFDDALTTTATTTDAAPATTVDATSIDDVSTSTAMIIETTSIEAISTSTSEAAPILSTEAASTIDPTTTSTTEVSSAVESTPATSTYYLKSTSSDSTFTGLFMQVKGADLTPVALVPPSSDAASYYAGQFHLEEDTNRLMVDEFYVVVTPVPVYELLIARSNLVTINAYVTCTPFVQGQAISCKSGTSNTEFATVSSGQFMYLLPSGFLTTRPRVTFTATTSTQ